MTPEQARAVASLADALTECERVGLPAVHVRAEGDPAVLVPVMRIELGRRDSAHRGWETAGLRVIRTLGGSNPWHLSLAVDPS